MKRFTENFCSFVGGAFFMLAIYGIGVASLEIWLPCLAISAMIIVMGLTE